MHQLANYSVYHWPRMLLNGIEHIGDIMGASDDRDARARHRAAGPVVTSVDENGPSWEAEVAPHCVEEGLESAPGSFNVDGDGARCERRQRKS